MATTDGWPDCVISNKYRRMTSKVGLFVALDKGPHQHHLTCILHLHVRHLLVQSSTGPEFRRDSIGTEHMVKG